jgi:hypothetical protein
MVDHVYIAINSTNCESYYRRTLQPSITPPPQSQLDPNSCLSGPFVIVDSILSLLFIFFTLLNFLLHISLHRYNVAPHSPAFARHKVMLHGMLHLIKHALKSSIIQGFEVFFFAKDRIKRAPLYARY